MKIALVTYQDEGKYAGEGASEDKHLLQFLQGKGLDVRYEIWTDAEVKWEQYEALVLKSPWDYFDKIDAFRNWLILLEARNIPLLNPNPIVRWNTDKRYLLDIEKKEFTIVPTKILEIGSTANLAPYFLEWRTEKVVIKPAISGGAKNTWQLAPTQIPSFEPQLTALLQEEAYLIQPFMSEIQIEGEWSLIYFNNRFSHAVLKIPKPGDFRVQHYFGGIIIPGTPPDFILDYAQKLLPEVAPGCLYARLDGIISEGIFKLMELELIEPMLYMQQNGALYENYYRALTELLSK